LSRRVATSCQKPPLFRRVVALSVDKWRTTHIMIPRFQTGILQTL
jgi:hypothetical protein